MKLNQRGEGEIIGLIFVGLLIWGGVGLYNHFNKPKAMKGWSLIYLNQANLSTVAGNYPTRQECAQKLQIARNNPNMHRPECGSNCRLSDTFDDMYVCDETFEL